jgi:hypothetical protein
MAEITSVRSTVIAAKRGLAITIALVGLLMLDGPESGLGVLLLIIGGVWAFSVKNRHAVTLSSASGKVQAVVSKDRAYIDKIVQAVKEAIAYRK